MKPATQLLETPMQLQYCMRDKTREDKPSKDIPPSVFNTIAAAIATEPMLLPTAPGALQLSYEDGFAVVVLDEDEKPVGYTRLHFLFGYTDYETKSGAWLELGSTWVHHRLRGNGINEQMYRMLLPLHTEQNIMATTTSMVSLSVGERVGFVPIFRRQLEQKVWEDSCCCPHEKTHSEDKKNHGCKLARGEPQCNTAASCWFRITPETARRLHLAP
jgi:GNAT superfamily N-acetyltransferase